MCRRSVLGAVASFSLFFMLVLDAMFMELEERAAFPKPELSVSDMKGFSVRQVLETSKIRAQGSCLF